MVAIENFSWGRYSKHDPLDELPTNAAADCVMNPQLNFTPNTKPKIHAINDVKGYLGGNCKRVSGLSIFSFVLQLQRHLRSNYWCCFFSWGNRGIISFSYSGTGVRWCVHFSSGNSAYAYSCCCCSCCWHIYTSIFPTL